MQAGEVYDASLALAADVALSFEHFFRFLVKFLVLVFSGKQVIALSLELLEDRGVDAEDLLELVVLDLGLVSPLSGRVGLDFEFFVEEEWSLCVEAPDDVGGYVDVGEGGEAEGCEDEGFVGVWRLVELWDRPGDQER